MNTGALKKDMKLLVGNIPYFVVAADESVDFDIFPYFVIQNTDTKYEPGSHWITWYVLSQRRCEYFDSFGYPFYHYPNLKCPSDYIVCDNTRQLQSDDSNYCGVWSLRYAYDRSRGISCHNFIRQWGNNPYCNDSKLINWAVSRGLILDAESEKNQSCCNLKILKNKIKPRFPVI